MRWDAAWFDICIKRRRMQRDCLGIFRAMQTVCRRTMEGCAGGIHARVYSGKSGSGNRRG